MSETFKIIGFPVQKKKFMNLDVRLLFLSEEYAVRFQKVKAINQETPDDLLCHGT